MLEWYVVWVTSLCEGLVDNIGRCSPITVCISINQREWEMFGATVQHDTIVDKKTLGITCLLWFFVERLKLPVPNLDLSPRDTSQWVIPQVTYSLVHVPSIECLEIVVEWYETLKEMYQILPSFGLWPIPRTRKIGVVYQCCFFFCMVIKWCVL